MHFICLVASPQWPPRSNKMYFVIASDIVLTNGFFCKTDFIESLNRVMIIFKNRTGESIGFLEI